MIDVKVVNESSSIFFTLNDLTRVPKGNSKIYYCAELPCSQIKGLCYYTVQLQPLKILAEQSLR